MKVGIPLATTYYAGTYRPPAHRRRGLTGSPGSGAAPVRPGHGLAYAPGLDGVRAVAVFAVVLYHLGTTGLVLGSGGRLAPGGFLGVDVFFVLSGFLITSLLIAERASTGRISIKRFYLRRARRLLPALYLMLFVVAAAASLAYQPYAARLRGDLLAALGYVTNWWLIAGGTSYFGAGVHPPLLTHLWSLAVEEQFYLIWPLLLMALVRFHRRLSAMAVVGLLIAASAGLAALLYQPLQDASRVYYGTDTRLATPLIGALLAMVVQPWRWRGRLRPLAGWALSLAGAAATAALVWAVLHLDDQDPRLYRGGFLAVAGLAAVLVLVAARPEIPLARLLGAAPLRWLGERSYAVYLWHWPVFTVTQPGINTSLNAGSSTAIRIGVTLLLSDLSFRFVEKPVRSGALGRLYRRWQAAPRGRRAAGSLAGAATLATVATLVTLIGGQLVAAAPPSSAPVGPGPDLSLGALASPSPATATPLASASPTASPTVSPTVSPIAGGFGAAHVPTVAVFGDSQGMTLLINKPKDTGEYVHFIDDTIEGCGVLLGTVHSRSGEHRDLAAGCHSWLSTWTSRMTRDRPDLGLIMIGAWDVFNLTVNGTTLTFGTPAWDANFTAQLQLGIDAIRSHGAPVALALLPCYRPVPGSAGYWPERGDDFRTRHVNTLLQAAAGATGVTTVNPPAQFCTDPKISTSLSYRWDGVHYYKPGALLYCQVLIPQLLAIRPG